MRKLVVDNRFFSVAESFFRGRYEMIPSPVIEGLPPETASHPDMGLVRAGNVFVAEKSVYDYYKKVLPEANLVCGKTRVSRHYPMDVAYNVLISETVAFGNEAYIDLCVKDTLKKQGIPLVSVSQGYAKCSCAYVSHAIITADKSIEKAAKEQGIKTLLISPGDVLLKGYDYGFIGGASGEILEGLFFFGDIKKHRDFQKIDAFLKENNVGYEFIEDFPLTDVGTVILV